MTSDLLYDHLDRPVWSAPRSVWSHPVIERCLVEVDHHLLLSHKLRQPDSETPQWPLLSLSVLLVLVANLEIPDLVLDVEIP